MSDPMGDGGATGQERLKLPAVTDEDVPGGAKGAGGDSTGANEPGERHIFQPYATPRSAVTWDTAEPWPDPPWWAFTKAASAN